MLFPFSELLRIDPLTGCKNYLGFLETLKRKSLPDAPAIERPKGRVGKYQFNASVYSALFFVDMNDITVLNETKGHHYGDSALRWMGILLREETNCEVYRVGGDEFAVLLKLATRENHLELAERILKRMELEASNFGFPDVAADIALIFFDQATASLDTLLLQMGEAMVTVKNSPGVHFQVFDAANFRIQRQTPMAWKSDRASEVSFAVRWLSLNNIYQVLEMGKILDDTQQEAYTDAISGLPNMKAALHNLEKALETAQVSQKPFSMMMIDGDNIRLYNDINYAAGDQMIRDMSAVLKHHLRPSDFVARWRTGDEFVVILPDTHPEDARIIGERFRLSVMEASRSWKFPVSISIGIASYPLHGETIHALIDKAEYANKRAKDQGKNQVVLAE